MRLLFLSIPFLVLSLAVGQSPDKPTKKDELKKKMFGGFLTVDALLKQFDTDGDGKISKAEAKGRILENFERFDLNKDGYLDRKELGALVETIRAQKGPGPFGGAGSMSFMDFDALDKNADGRLTRDELKGTPWEKRFDEIDTDKSGQIDRREFEQFLKKIEKVEKVDKK
jgi:Ca2+-binding EF-hand superfamily protein